MASNDFLSLYNKFSGLESNVNCGSSWGLGVVGCAETSLELDNIDYTLSLLLNDIYDGQKIQFTISTQAGVYSGSNGGVDFGNTAHIGLTTSNGVTWESESGVFLSAASNPPEADVPEPSIIALFGLGLVGLGFARRRRQA